MIDRNPTEVKSYVTNVKVLDVEKRYRPGSKHYVYVIQVTWTNPTNVFIIYRRYAQFFDLQCKLLDLFADVSPSPLKNSRTTSRQIPFLPGKILFGRSQIREIALERKHALNIYCRTLISLPERISRSRPVLQFFQPSSTDVINPSPSMIERRKATATAAMAISKPLKLPVYRCVDNFQPVEKMEIAVKRNSNVQVIQKHINGWWFVQNGDRTGFVPGAFLMPIDGHNDHRELSSMREEETYVVNHSYNANSSDEISLDQGSFVVVLEKSFTGWWRVKFNDSIGQFPAVYLTSWDGRPLPRPITQDFSQSDNPMNSVQNINTTNRYESETTDDDDDCPIDSIQETTKEIFYVHTDFNDNVGDCISLQRGQMVEIHQQHPSGWWLGRRLDTHQLTLSWIPSAFLQKEPIIAPPVEEGTSSAVYLNLKEERHLNPRENIYQNLGDVLRSPVIKPKVTRQKVSPLTSIADRDDSSQVSVRDLVNRFNRS